MSQENVEIVRRSIEAWNQRDPTPALASWRFDAEIDWSRSDGPLKGVYRGHAELQAFWDAFWSTFEEVQLQAHAFTEAGSEVVVPNTAHFRGARGLRSSRGARSYTRSRMGRSHAFGCSRSEPKPSRPPGSWSRPAVACLRGER